MRAAPAFQVELRSAPIERWLVSLWCGLSCAVFTVWIVEHAGAQLLREPITPWITALAAFLSGAGGAMAARPWLQRERAVLAWSQGRWSWQLASAEASTASDSLDLMLDLGAWMLLRHSVAGRRSSRWFSVAESDAGPQWHALRATLYLTGAVARLESSLTP